MSTLTLTHAQVLDPSLGINQLSDIVIEYGFIIDITAAGEATSTNPKFDAEKALVIPGLIDLSTHIQNIASETVAAAKGGITHLCTDAKVSR